VEVTENGTKDSIVPESPAVEASKKKPEPWYAVPVFLGVVCAVVFAAVVVLGGLVKGGAFLHHVIGWFTWDEVVEYADWKEATQYNGLAYETDEVRVTMAVDRITRKTASGRAYVAGHLQDDRKIVAFFPWYNDGEAGELRHNDTATLLCEPDWTELPDGGGDQFWFCNVESRVPDNPSSSAGEPFRPYVFARQWTQLNSYNKELGTWMATFYLDNSLDKHTIMGTVSSRNPMVLERGWDKRANIWCATKYDDRTYGDCILRT
jgi:hypothetical protein